MKEQPLYAVVDLETTGGRANRDKIIEIGIVIHDGHKIIETFHSLVNPERYVPYGITQLTGITQEMVQDAPKFYEIARQVVEITEGRIFVAHNVRFDYSFLREEFKRLGFTYTRKKLCTVRLTRKTFPGFPSYSLGNLIKRMDIAVNDRHRALDDALATAEILRRILSQEQNKEQVESMINLGVKEALLPKNFDIEKIHALPEACGVYYFHNAKGDVIYVGKSINIKKRIAEHFADKTEKATKLQQQAHDISYEITGSELIALLLESNEIKRLRPEINRAQRVRRFPYVIHTFENDQGYICFEIRKIVAKDRSKYKIIAEYPKASNAKSHLVRMRETYHLCSKYCGIDRSTKACFHYHIQQCIGACIEEESVEEYNERATQARERLYTIFDEDFFILDKGREPHEAGIILVENGDYKGYGYIDEQHTNLGLEDLRSAISPFAGNPETTRLIQRFLSKNNGVRVLKL
jgi:DNA polymerase-3 subunit epsilon